MTSGLFQPEMIGVKERQEAILALLQPGSGRAMAARFERYATENSIGLDWIWGCRDAEGTLESSVLCVPSAGRTAMIFLSSVRNQDQVQQRATLLRHALSYLEDQDVDLGQSLLSCDDNLGHDAHVAGGLEPLTTLLYMERSLTRACATPPPAPGVELIAWTDCMDDTLGCILDASYEETLDCAGLCGLRRTEDIILGHKSSGRHDPDGWLLAKIDDVFAGAVLVNHSREHGNIELVYLGLAPPVRGRGLGRHLLETQLARYSGSTFRRMTLAVDTKNLPAIQIYEDLGFRGTSHRNAYISSLAGRA